MEPKWNRVQLLHGGPDGAKGHVSETHRRCGHEHPTREEAVRCDHGGPVVIEEITQEPQFIGMGMPTGVRDGY